MHDENNTYLLYTLLYIINYITNITKIYYYILLL